MWTLHWEPRCADALMTCVPSTYRIGLIPIAAATPLSCQPEAHQKSLLSGIFAEARRKGCFDGVNPVRDTAIYPTAETGATYASF
jgi:hypothetical protein